MIEYCKVAQPPQPTSVLKGLVIVSWSRAYQKKAYALYDMDMHRQGLPAFALKRSGEVRVFETRSGARGVRSKINHEKMPHTTLKGEY